MKPFKETLTELVDKVNSMEFPGIKGCLWQKRSTVGKSDKSQKKTFVLVTPEIIDKIKTAKHFTYRYETTNGKVDRNAVQESLKEYLKEYDSVCVQDAGASVSVNCRNVHGWDFTVSVKELEYTQPGTETEQNFERNIGEYLDSNVKNILLTDGTKEFLISDIKEFVNESRIETNGKDGEVPRRVDFQFRSADGKIKNISLKSENYADVDHVGSYRIEEFGFDKMLRKYITDYDCYVRPHYKEKNTYVFRLGKGAINAPFREFGNYTSENVFYGSCDAVVIVKKDGSLEDLGDMDFNGKTYRKLKVNKLYIRHCDKKHKLGLKIRNGSGRLFGYLKNVYVDCTGKLVYDKKHTGGVNIRGLSTHIVSLENQKYIQKGVMV